MRINHTGRALRPALRRPGALRSLASLCPVTHRTFLAAVPPARDDPQGPAQPSVHAGVGGKGRRRATRPAPTVLRVAAYASDGCIVITVAGELDVATAPSLADALHHVPAPVPIILDLAGVTFMDCAGLHPILHAHRAAAARGTPIVLVPTPAIARLLRLTGTQYIPASPTMPAALATVTAHTRHSPS